MKKADLYYLRSILRQLRELRPSIERFPPTLGGEALSDNIDWLNCFIDKYERAQQKQKEKFAAAMTQRRAVRDEMR